MLLCASSFDPGLIQPKSRKTGAKKNHELSAQNAKLLALAEQVAHFGSWEWDVTKPRAIWSPELFRIFGIEPKPEGLTLEEYRSFIHPDDLERISKKMDLSRAKVKLNQTSRADYRIVRPDGSIRIIYSQRQIKEVTDKGKLKVIVGVDQDVTEQKQAEEALRQSEERFRAVAEAANVLVYEYDLVDNKDHFIRGEKELTGFEPKEGGEYPIEDILSRIHPDDVPNVLAAWNKTKKDPNVNKYSVEYRFLHKSGSYLIVKDTAKAVKDSKGETVLFIGGIRDITQRKLDQYKIRQYSKNLEELVEERTRQLQEKERLAAIGATAGMVGHDIRNPLQALTSEVYLIKTELDNIPQNQAKQSINESLDNIEQGIMYINKIIADLQDYSRPLSPEFQKVNLANFVDCVIKTIAFPDNVKLLLNIESVSDIILEQTFTRRALTNLINNAIQAMPDGGQLEVAVYQEKDDVTIIVADTGVGISDEVKGKLFTPMFTTKAKGQGLGLAVVKRLVEAQGGSICFESKEGEGTKFQIKLPMSRE
jgi:PAS domain S-box-containing protein